MLRRTPGGLKSQGIFYNSDLVFYIEGKTHNKVDGDDTTYDQMYYEMLSSYFLSGRKVKIKVVGSCNDVMDIHQDVVKGNVLDTICFIDRDYSGLKFSRLRDFRLIKTYGYSWENDFWSINLSDSIMRMFTNNNAQCSREAKDIISNTIKRLSFLHIINLISSYHGFKLFNLGVKGGVDGIQFIPTYTYGVSKLEITRILAPLKSSISLADMKSEYKKQKIEDVRAIQGHYLEYVYLRVMKEMIQKYAKGHSTAKESTLKNLSFYKFGENLGAYWSQNVVDYYQSKLSLF